MFQAMDYGIIGKGKNKHFTVNIIDLKNYGGRYAIDQPTYGSHGMLLTAEPIHQAIVQNNLHNVIYTSPRGKVWTNDMAVSFAKQKTINILCGRYEGIDQRVIEEHSMTEISIGDFVLSGGELAAMVMIDSIGRFAGAVKEKSLYDSFSDGLLENDNYTRPYTWRHRTVPQVLIDGNHKEINLWKQKNSIDNTFKNRNKLLFKKLIELIENKIS